MSATTKKSPVFPYSDTDLARMKRVSAQRHTMEPHAVGVRYHTAARQLFIELRDGAMA